MKNKIVIILAGVLFYSISINAVALDFGGPIGRLSSDMPTTIFLNPKGSMWFKTSPFGTGPSTGNPWIKANHPLAAAVIPILKGAEFGRQDLFPGQTLSYTTTSNNRRVLKTMNMLNTTVSAARMQRIWLDLDISFAFAQVASTSGVPGSVLSGQILTPQQLSAAASAIVDVKAASLISGTVLVYNSATGLLDSFQRIVEVLVEPF